MVKKRLLVDTNSLGTRAFHTSHSSFFSMMGKLLREFDPKEVIFAFDGRGNWRSTIYPEYKANRKAKSTVEAEVKGLRKDYLRKLWQALRKAGFTVMAFEGFEADDVLYTLAAIRFLGGNIVVSSDKDMFAMADIAEILWFGGSFNDRRLFDSQAVYEKMGLLPEQIAWYKALAGEQSDNIPGVPQIGDVRAKKLISEGWDAIMADNRVQANLTLFNTSLELAQFGICTPALEQPLTGGGDLNLAEKVYNHLTKQKPVL